MEQLLASRSVSITELKRSPSTVIEQAGSEPVAVLNHNRPAAYLLPHAAYQQLLDRLRAAEICVAIATSRNDPRPAIAADTVFAELDALIDEVEAEQKRP
ncbi:antitoxin StbD [Pseudomonas sp. PvR086]|jgi:antitoxin StbD|uniref:Antitoxin StbD n=3 Tax=Pseudomonas TaxID=286 RepID=A0ACC5MLI7_9PSED|nr:MULTISPECIES: type II toxin-antitoxin system prevent-host-death family antitoxin [Pseudomonas]ATE80296.1 type II toxin-antitoxin system prevent-host-death family antitoxin [Pseudomonas frederiksbergensis]MBB2889566.1 antitoxin StbD [Pseudomonas umsongensis]MBD9604662.1 type II toxin-antitoxin system prevent-host-death family antitoxin [Pseudomonas sp. PDM08]MDR7105453.1 antitoxin StbD [Pseudomonas frederiksbergensis]NMN76462.1 antitoxin StbD [Pseudomonas sp. KD5]